MHVSYIKEACVTSKAEAVTAALKGANRLELCVNLECGGLTPSSSIINEVMAQVQIPVRVMIRTRSGDFIYNDAEIEQMKASIASCKTAQVEGIVFGVLNEGNTLNLKAIKELSEYAQPLKIVIHKAIDACEDPVVALKSLLKLSLIDTVLTSGGRETAEDGIPILAQMIKIAGSKIEIMPAGKITKHNLTKLHSHLAARAYHGKLIVGALN